MDNFEFRAWDGKSFEYDICVGSHTGDLKDAKPTVVIIDDDDCWYPHEPFIKVTQYIGRKDKNKKKIFVGDIIRKRAGKSTIGGYRIGQVMVIACVVYSAKSCSFVMRRGLDFAIIEGMDLEVIGNVFENLELLD